MLDLQAASGVQEILEGKKYFSDEDALIDPSLTELKVFKRSAIPWSLKCDQNPKTSRQRGYVLLSHQFATPELSHLEVFSMMGFIYTFFTIILFITCHNTNKDALAPTLQYQYHKYKLKCGDELQIL